MCGIFLKERQCQRYLASGLGTPAPWVRYSRVHQGSYTWVRYLRVFPGKADHIYHIRGLGTASAPHISVHRQRRCTPARAGFGTASTPACIGTYMLGSVPRVHQQMCRCIHTHMLGSVQQSTPARRRQPTVSGYQTHGPLRGSRGLYLTQLVGIGNAHRLRSARAPPSG